MRDNTPNHIPPGYDSYIDTLPTTLEDRLFGPFIYGSEPVTDELSSVRRMGSLLKSIRAATMRAYPEFLGATTQHISSYVHDERSEAWSGYVAVSAVHSIPTDSPDITLSLVIEMLSGHRHVQNNPYTAADATRASILWHDHKTRQGLAISVTTNGNGYYHGCPSFSMLSFANDRTDSVISRAQLSATDTQIGQSLNIAEQALGSLKGHGREITGPGDIVNGDRRPYIAELTGNASGLVPLGHHFTTEMLREHPWRTREQEQWRNQP